MTTFWIASPAALTAALNSSGDITGPPFFVGSGFAVALGGGAGRAGVEAAEGASGRTNMVCFADADLADPAGFADNDGFVSDEDLACTEGLGCSEGGTVGLTSPLAETGVLNLSEIIGRRGGEVIHLSVIAASSGWRHLVP